MRSMRILSVCAAALAASIVVSAAADMPSKAGPSYSAPAAPSNSWAGVYVGGSAGFAKLDTDPSFGTSLDGYTYGGHLGFQVQKGWVVAGIEAGVTNYANVKSNGFGCDCLVADLLGKVGFTVTPNVLVYGVAGGFWHNATTGGLLPQFGWTVGGGLDWQPFNDHVIVGGRYQYRNLEVPNTPLTVFAHEFKVHLDYKF